MDKRKIFTYCSAKLGMFVMLTLYAGVLGGCGKQTSSSVDEKQASEIQEVVQRSEAEQEESDILTSPAEETQIEEPPQVQSITITATGDCTLGAAQIAATSFPFAANSRITRSTVSSAPKLVVPGIPPGKTIPS